MERVKGLFPDGLPVDPKKQNSEWFQLYREYQDELQVFYSHKAFLLTRDLASLTVIFIPLSIFGHFLVRQPVSDGRLSLMDSCDFIRGYIAISQTLWRAVCGKCLG